MYKYVIYICTFSICLAGCDLTKNQEPSVVISTAITISYINQGGEDLLDPNHPHAITKEDITIYYLIDGEKKRYFEGNLDHPKGLFISDEKLSNRYYLRVFANTIRGEDTATTYIQFKDTTEDTIRVAYDYFNDGGSVAVTKVWYNGERKVDFDDDEIGEGNTEHVGRYFTITKSTE